MSIEVKNLYKYYGEQAAVRDVSFSIKKGEIVAFLGPNGAGKSTTMKIMTGFMPASEGEVFICGKKVDIDKLDTRQIIGYLPENNPLYTDMYVREYLEFVGRIYKIKNLKANTYYYSICQLKSLRKIYFPNFFSNSDSLSKPESFS